MPEQCLQCGHEIVYITEDVVKQSINKLKPNFRTLSDPPSPKFGGTYAICPCCDAYALDAELEEGFPFFLPDGTETTVHAISLG